MAKPTSPPGQQNAPGLPPVVAANVPPNAAGGPLTLPTISMVDVYSWEGDETVIQMKLDRASSQPVTVNYAVAFESPTPSTHKSASADDFENLDRLPLTGTVTFAPGALEHLLFIDIADDTTWEGNEAFKVVFSNPVGAKLDPTRNYASGFIAENDPAPPPPVPVISVSDAHAWEGGMLAFAVTLSAPAGQTVTVSAESRELAGGGAVLWSDFSGIYRDVTFVPGGPLTQTVEIPVWQDTVAEPTETMRLHLYNPVGATVGRSDGIGTIFDDDEAVVTPPPPLEPQPLTWTVSDGSAAEGGSLPITISLNQPAPAGLTFGWEIRFGSAGFEDLFTMIAVTGVPSGWQFPVGESSLTFTFNPIDDTAPEGNEEFFLDIFNVSAGTVVDGTGQGTIFASDQMLIA